jgi:hypothetical protein
MSAGPTAGLEALKALERAGGDPRPDLERAISLATNDGERQLLERRLRQCTPVTDSL